MLVVETIVRILREHLGKGVPIKQIARELRLSRKTVRKVVCSGETSFGYERKLQTMPKLPQAMGRVRARLSRHRDGERHMVAVLAAVLEDGLEAVKAACGEALDSGTCSADVVLNLLARRRDPKPCEPIETPQSLRLRHPPMADCQRYDRLRELDHGAP